MLRGVSLIVQSTFRDGLSFDPVSLCQNRLPAPEVNVGWGQVFQALMVSLMIVVIDEGADLLFQIAGQRDPWTPCPRGSSLVIFTPTPQFSVCPTSDLLFATCSSL